MTDLIAVHISRENNLHLQSLAKKNNCTVDDLINEAVCEYYADEIRQADTPQTEMPKWTKENCKGCKYNEYPYDYSDCFIKVCIDGNKYEPKQTDCGWK